MFVKTLPLHPSTADPRNTTSQVLFFQESHVTGRELKNLWFFYCCRGDYSDHIRNAPGRSFTQKKRSPGTKILQEQKKKIEGREKIVFSGQNERHLEKEITMGAETFVFCCVDSNLFWDARWKLAEGCLLKIFNKFLSFYFICSAIKRFGTLLCVVAAGEGFRSCLVQTTVRCVPSCDKIWTKRHSTYGFSRLRRFVELWHKKES